VFVAEFAPGTLDRGPIETQPAARSEPVSAATVVFDTGGDQGCGEAMTVAAALTKPNTAEAGDCLFEAQIQLITGVGEADLAGQCDDWRRDVSYCWVDGDLGQFWLRREPPPGKSLTLILGPYTGEGAVPAIAPGEAPAPSIPRRGIMLESRFDDAGRAILDRWLLLPAQFVSLPLVPK